MLAGFEHTYHDKSLLSRKNEVSWILPDKLAPSCHLRRCPSQTALVLRDSRYMHHRVPPLTWCDCPPAGQWQTAWVYLQTLAGKARSPETECRSRAAQTLQGPAAGAVGSKGPNVLGPSAQSARGRQSLVFRIVRKRKCRSENRNNWNTKL